MCLITVALEASPRFRVVVAANRDERHARPSAPAAWWDDAPGILGGRDLVAGGTWLAVGRDARVAAVTNRPPPAEPARVSRGTLVPAWLTGAATASDYAAVAAADAASYGAFNLVLVDAAGECVVVSSLGERVRFTAGIRSFGNAALDADWPKLNAATAGVERALEAADPAAALFDVLALRVADPPGQGPDRENPFIAGVEFGTRCSTVVLVDGQRRVTFAERRYDSAARVTGETRFTFAGAAPDELSATR